MNHTITKPNCLANLLLKLTPCPSLPVIEAFGWEGDSRDLVR